jgi:hypothetical protein
MISDTRRSGGCRAGFKLSSSAGSSAGSSGGSLDFCFLRLGKKVSFSAEAMAGGGEGRKIVCSVFVVEKD